MRLWLENLRPGIDHPLRLDIRDYVRIVVLTGAGVSVASGIRPFRGPGGLWAPDAEGRSALRLSHAQALVDEPQAVWRLFGGLRAQIGRAQPNAAHRALAQLEAGLRPDQQFLLLTQNGDGLHQRAGSQRVVELHGNLRSTRCTRRGCHLPPFNDDRAYADALPLCPACAAPLRPDVVMFDEPLPVDALWQARRALRDCDLFLAIGTSGSVEPAASFVRSADDAGARTLWINPEPLDPPNRCFQQQALGPAEQVLPDLLGVPG